jgi:hypothetical protein
MKTYKTVQEWLDSNPEKEVIERVLSTVNRTAISEGRKELKEKKEEIARVERVILQMEKLSLPIGKEVKDVYNTLSKDIKNLEKALPPSPYGKKKEEGQE